MENLYWERTILDIILPNNSILVQNHNLLNTHNKDHQYFFVNYHFLSGLNQYNKIFCILELNLIYSHCFCTNLQIFSVYFLHQQLLNINFYIQYRVILNPNRLSNYSIFYYYNRLLCLHHILQLIF